MLRIHRSVSGKHPAGYLQSGRTYTHSDCWLSHRSNLAENSKCFWVWLHLPYYNDKSRRHFSGCIFSAGGFGFWPVSCEKEQPAKRKKRKQIFATAWLMSCWRGLNLLRPSLMYQFVAPLHDEWVTSLSGRFCALILSLATKQRYVIYFLSQNKNQ